jgi:outer membrane protein TolC
VRLFKAIAIRNLLLVMPAGISLLANLLLGCAQSEYRVDADREVYAVIAERNSDPRWSAKKISVEMDPRSRFFDPWLPDRSPMPMDDPAANEYMQEVDGHSGWEHWLDNGVRKQLENPAWRSKLDEYAKLTEDGSLLLDIDSSVSLAYLHSPLHQLSLESLYLSALDVTGERFRLDTQFFGGSNASARHQGRKFPAAIAFNPGTGSYTVNDPGVGIESNRLELTTDFEARRRLATAGEVLAGFANTFAFELTEGDVNLASSLASFSIVQPLLRGAGRDVALEQLTLDERRLLGNLRAYSQFRQGFFTQVVIGELGVRGPSRGGSGTSLQSFSGFGGVGGYLGLLEQARQIRNTRDNLELQLRTLDRLDALYDNELIDIVQVDQFRQDIESSKALLLDQTNRLELSVDNFKTQILGLPPDIPVVLDEQLVSGFQLLPIEGTPILNQLLNLQRRLGDLGELSALLAQQPLLQDSLRGLPGQEPEVQFQTLRELQRTLETTTRRLQQFPVQLSQLQRDTPDFLTRIDAADRDLVSTFLQSYTADSAQTAGSIRSLLTQINPLIEQLTNGVKPEYSTDFIDSSEASLLEARAIYLIQAESRQLSREPQQVLQDISEIFPAVTALFDTARSDLQQLDEVARMRLSSMASEDQLRFLEDRDRLQERLLDLEQGPNGSQTLDGDFSNLRGQIDSQPAAATIRDLTAWIQSYLQLVERLTLIPAQARLELIAVEEIELAPDAAFEFALQNRLDFMNGRAALVDDWRAIQVAADALQSNLTITGGGDLRTARNNPIDFRTATSRLRLGLEFDAPLTRLLERNGYRETLIRYQQSRRNFIQSQDSLQKGVRALLRTLNQRRRQLEIQRRAVSIALRRVDQTQLSLLAPPPQLAPGMRAQINPTIAYNLLAAQSSLQRSQNSFLSAWLDYYASRLRLYRELGIMQLDASGRWIERSVELEEVNSTAASTPLPPEIPELTDSTEEIAAGTQNSQDSSSDLPSVPPVPRQ